MGGKFTVAGGVSVNSVAKWESDTPPQDPAPRRPIGAFGAFGAFGVRADGRRPTAATDQTEGSHRTRGARPIVSLPVDSSAMNNTASPEASVSYVVWVGVLLIIAWLLLAGVTAAHAVMYKRDARSSAIWLLLSFFLPFVGSWLYWVIGINRIERRAVKHLGKREQPFTAPAVDPETIESAEQACISGPLQSLYRASQRVTRLPMLPGNSVTPLHNGEQAFPKMLEAIEQAEQSITLASYIFDWDDVGRRFAGAMEAAATRGVRVHVLVDGVGALGHFSRMGRLLLRSGAEVASFFPLRFPLGRLRINLRNHRKILVVDGRIGFTGGMNITERHLVTRDKPQRAEDLHFELHGPIVGELQHTFAEDWRSATGRELRGVEYFPHLDLAGHTLCRGIVSGPDEDFEDIHIIIRAALSAAQKSVRMVTPYYVPTPSLISATTTAALRGVNVKLVLPGVVDLPYMRWAADAYLWQLLERGIEVYRRPPPFAHTKIMIVDDQWVLFGSANLDRRSFRLNFEFNVEAYDEAFAADMRDHVDGVIANANAVTLAQMDARPIRQRLRDGTVKLFSPYL